MNFHGDRLVSAFKFDLTEDRFPDERTPDFYLLDLEAATGVPRDRLVDEGLLGVGGIFNQVA